MHDVRHVRAYPFFGSSPQGQVSSGASLLRRDDERRGPIRRAGGSTASLRSSTRDLEVAACDRCAGCVCEATVCPGAGGVSGRRCVRALVDVWTWAPSEGGCGVGGGACRGHRGHTRGDARAGAASEAMRDVWAARGRERHGLGLGFRVRVRVRVRAARGRERRGHAGAPENVTKQNPLEGDQSLTLESPPAVAMTVPPGE